jgi:hypothetical protein
VPAPPKAGAGAAEGGKAGGVVFSRDAFFLEKSFVTFITKTFLE